MRFNQGGHKGLLEKVTGISAWEEPSRHRKENSAKVGVCPACLRNGREAVWPEQWAMREQRVMRSGRMDGALQVKVRTRTLTLNEPSPRGF